MKAKTGRKTAKKVGNYFTKYILPALEDDMGDLGKPAARQLERQFSQLGRIPGVKRLMKAGDHKSVQQIFDVCIDGL